MVQDNNSVLIDVAQLEVFIGAMLRHADLPDADAATVARLMAVVDGDKAIGHLVMPYAVGSRSRRHALRHG
jgi:LDH2 family malate/lactate/ureidoglycolate dehydrogenase